MAYSKTNWIDGGEPAITAGRLNKLETQYDEAVKYVDVDTETVRDRTAVASNTNWDTVIKAGSYSVSGITMSTTNKSPVGAGTYGTLHVFKVGSSITQLYISDTQRAVDPTVNGSVWYRTNIGGTWGPWRSLNSDNNIIPAILSGSSMSSAAGLPVGISMYALSGNGTGDYPATSGIVVSYKISAQKCTQFFYGVGTAQFGDFSTEIYVRENNPTYNVWNDWRRIDQGETKLFIDVTKATMAVNSSTNTITGWTQNYISNNSMNASTGTFIIKHKGNYLITVEAKTPPFTGSFPPSIYLGGGSQSDIIELNEKNTRGSRVFRFDPGSYYFRMGPYSGGGNVTKLRIQVVEL